MFNCKIHITWIIIACLKYHIHASDTSHTILKSMMTVNIPAFIESDSSYFCTANFAKATHRQTISHLLLASSTTRYTPSQRTINVNSKGALLYLSILLISTSSDIELNPGPYKTRRVKKPKYPCGECGRAVTWSKTRKSIACDNCSTWYHTDCIRMKSKLSSALAHPTAEWTCTDCGMPNFATSLFESDKSNISINSSITSDPGSPILASTPVTPRTKATKHQFRILQANCQSYYAKLESIWELIDSTDPDIFLGSETWLKKHHVNGELTPPGYNTFRKDRHDGYGGVIILAKNNIICNEITLDNDTELIAIKIETNTSTPLIVFSCYRPPNNNQNALEEICNTVRKVVISNPNAACWFAGDINLPDINWESNSVSGNQYPKAINDSFINMVYDLGFEQIVTEKTRGQNILDIFLTNRPTLIQRTELLPGISDHDCVLTISDLQAKRQRPTKRLIHLWDRGNLESLKSDAQLISSSTIKNFNTATPIEELWNHLKTEFKRIVQAHIPTKETSSRYSQPWIDRAIKTLCRKKRKP